MGRTSKYNDNRLLDAVIQYSEKCVGKIKLTALAEWARNNIAGLEDVQDYHFVRPVKNPKTGKMEKRPCTQRIEELNAMRDLRKRIDHNVIMSGVSIDVFYDLPERDQRRNIEEARATVAEIKSSNTYLRRSISYLEAYHNGIKEKLTEVLKLTHSIKQKQEEVEKRISSVERKLEDQQIRAIAEEMGIRDEFFSITKYNESLRLDVSEMINMDEEIRKHQRKIKNESGSSGEEEGLLSLDELTDFDTGKEENDRKEFDGNGNGSSTT